MAIADLILTHVPLPQLPYHLTHYVRGATPLSTYPVVIGILVGHLAASFGIREIMKTRQPRKLSTFLFRLHSAILSSGSALLLVLMLEEIVPIHWRHGVFYALCNAGAWTERMELYYIINYYIKYVELLDTLYLALKKRSFAYAYMYHHSVTVFLCFTQLNGKTSSSWAVITQNLALHVLIYSYFYAAEGGAKVWWKEHIPIIQILQFIAAVQIVYFATYSQLASTYWPALPSLGSCQISGSASFFGCAILSSYLLLYSNIRIDAFKKLFTNGHVNGDAPKED